MGLKRVLFGHHVDIATGEPVYLMQATELSAHTLEYLASEMTGLLSTVVATGSKTYSAGLTEAHVLELQARVGAIHQCARDMRAWLEREIK